MNNIFLEIFKAFCWGHNDERLFISTNKNIYISIVKKSIASCSLLAQLRVRSFIRDTKIIDDLNLHLGACQISFVLNDFISCLSFYLRCKPSCEADLPADVYADDHRLRATERFNSTLLAPDLRPIPNGAGDAADC